MPTYDFKCSCGYEWDRVLKIAEMDNPLNEPCPDCGKSGDVSRHINTAPSMGDPVRLGIRRPDGSIKEVLQKINERAPASKIKDASTLTRL